MHESRILKKIIEEGGKDRICNRVKWDKQNRNMREEEENSRPLTINPVEHSCGQIMSCHVVKVFNRGLTMSKYC